MKHVTPPIVFRYEEQIKELKKEKENLLHLCKIKDKHIREKDREIERLKNLCPKCKGRYGKCSCD